MPANLFPSGEKKDGYMRMTPEGGFSGTVGITEVGDMRTMKGK